VLQLSLVIETCFVHEPGSGEKPKKRKYIYPTQTRSWKRKSHESFIVQLANTLAQEEFNERHSQNKEIA